MPAVWRNSSSDKCDMLPLPAVAKLSRPGRCLASAISSASERASTPRPSASTSGVFATCVSSRMSLSGSYGTLSCSVVQPLTERERACARQRDRIAVRLGLGGHLRPDHAAGAVAVLDHDGLAQEAG